MPLTAKEINQQRLLYKKYLILLTNTTENYIKAMDKIMKVPEGYECGKMIAEVINKLDMAKDMAKHFGLGKKL